MIKWKKKDNSDLSLKKNTNKNIKKIIRNLESGKCKFYKKSHKGHCYTLLEINPEYNNDCIISWREKQLIKLKDLF